MASTWHSGIANQPVFHFLSNCTAFTFELFSARFRFLNGPSRESGGGTESLIPLKLADNNRPTDPHSLKTLHQCKWNWDKRKMFICMFSLLVFFMVDCRTALALHIYEITGRSLLLHLPYQWLRWGDVYCWGGSIFFQLTKVDGVICNRSDLRRWPAGCGGGVIRTGLLCGVIFTFGGG